MALGGLIGNGVKVGYSSSSPLSYRKLEQVLDATPPKLTPDKVDTSRHGTSRFKSSIPGMLDVAPIAIKCLRDASTVTSPNVNAIQALVLSSSSLYLRIEVPAVADLSTFEAWELSGRFSNFSTSAPQMGRQEVDIEFMFDGIDYIYFAPTASVLG